MTNSILNWYWNERNHAIDKHGFKSTPENPEMPDHEKFIILAEEFGEVARALTYDEGNQENLKEELVQLATMALMWRQSLEPMSEGEPPAA